MTTVRSQWDVTMKRIEGEMQGEIIMGRSGREVYACVNQIRIKTTQLLGSQRLPVENETQLDNLCNRLESIAIGRKERLGDEAYQIVFEKIQVFRSFLGRRLKEIASKAPARQAAASPKAKPVPQQTKEHSMEDKNVQIPEPSVEVQYSTEESLQSPASQTDAGSQSSDKEAAHAVPVNLSSTESTPQELPSNQPETGWETASPTSEMTLPLLQSAELPLQQMAADEDVSAMEVVQQEEAVTALFAPSPEQPKKKWVRPEIPQPEQREPMGLQAVLPLYGTLLSSLQHERTKFEQRSTKEPKLLRAIIAAVREIETKLPRSLERFAQLPSEQRTVRSRDALKREFTQLYTAFERGYRCKAVIEFFQSLRNFHDQIIVAIDGAFPVTNSTDSRSANGNRADHSDHKEDSPDEEETEKEDPTETLAGFLRELGFLDVSEQLQFIGSQSRKQVKVLARNFLASQSDMVTAGRLTLEDVQQLSALLEEISATIEQGILQCGEATAACVAAGLKKPASDAAGRAALAAGCRKHVVDMLHVQAETMKDDEAVLGFLIADKSCELKSFIPEELLELLIPDKILEGAGYPMQHWEFEEVETMAKQSGHDPSQLLADAQMLSDFADRINNAGHGGYALRDADFVAETLRKAFPEPPPAPVSPATQLAVPPAAAPAVQASASVPPPSGSVTARPTGGTAAVAEAGKNTDVQGQGADRVARAMKAHISVILNRPVAMRAVDIDLAARAMVGDLFQGNEAQFNTLYAQLCASLEKREVEAAVGMLLSHRKTARDALAQDVAQRICREAHDSDDMQLVVSLGNMLIEYCSTQDKGRFVSFDGFIAERSRIIEEFLATGGLQESVPVPAAPQKKPLDVGAARGTAEQVIRIALQARKGKPFDREERDALCTKVCAEAYQNDQQFRGEIYRKINELAPQLAPEQVAKQERMLWRRAIDLLRTDKMLAQIFEEVPKDRYDFGVKQAREYLHQNIFDGKSMDLDKLTNVILIVMEYKVAKEQWANYTVPQLRDYIQSQVYTRSYEGNPVRGHVWNSATLVEVLHALQGSEMAKQPYPFGAFLQTRMGKLNPLLVELPAKLAVPAQETYQGTGPAEVQRSPGELMQQERVIIDKRIAHEKKVSDLSNPSVRQSLAKNITRQLNGKRNQKEWIQNDSLVLAELDRLLAPKESPVPTVVLPKETEAIHELPVAAPKQTEAQMTGPEVPLHPPQAAAGPASLQIPAEVPQTVDQVVEQQPHAVRDRLEALLQDPARFERILRAEQFIAGVSARIRGYREPVRVLKEKIDAMDKELVQMESDATGLYEETIDLVQQHDQELRQLHRKWLLNGEDARAGDAQSRNALQKEYMDASEMIDHAIAAADELAELRKSLESLQVEFGSLERSIILDGERFRSRMTDTGMGMAYIDLIGPEEKGIASQLDVGLRRAREMQAGMQALAETLGRIAQEAELSSDLTLEAMAAEMKECMAFLRNDVPAQSRAQSFRRSPAMTGSSAGYRLEEGDDDADDDIESDVHARGGKEHTENIGQLSAVQVRALQLMTFGWAEDPTSKNKQFGMTVKKMKDWLPRIFPELSELSAAEIKDALEMISMDIRPGGEVFWPSKEQRASVQEPLIVYKSKARQCKKNTSYYVPSYHGFDMIQQLPQEGALTDEHRAAITRLKEDAKNFSWQEVHARREQRKSNGQNQA